MFINYFLLLTLSLSLAPLAHASDPLKKTQNKLISNSLEMTKNKLISNDLTANPIDVELQNQKENKTNNPSQAETQNKSFQSQNLEELLELKQQISDLQRIFSEYQAPKIEEETLLVIKENPLNSYNKIISLEADYLTKTEKLNEILKLYYVLNNIKKEFQDLLKAQEQREQTFLDYSNIVQTINQLNIKQEQFNQRSLDIKKQIGQLDFEEISSFITLHKHETIFSSDKSLKDNLKKTTDLIPIVYINIDEEKRSLLTKGHVLAEILCDSSFYKNSQKKDCLNLLAVKSKADIENFLNSLSPQKWQETELNFENTKEFNQDYFELPSHQRLIETLWTLSQNQKAYHKFKSLWQSSDFYRWLYFVIKSQLEAREQSFSWEKVENTARKQKLEKTNSNTLEYTLLVELEEKRDRVASQLTKQENEYYNTINLLQIIFDIQSSDYKLDSQQIEPACLVSESPDIWIECINNYPSIIRSIQKQKQELEETLQFMLQHILFYTPFVVNSLKTQQTQILTNHPCINAKCLESFKKEVH